MMALICAAWPWLVMGISLAVVAVNANESERASSYYDIGMLLGVAWGIAFANVLSICLGMGASFGMFVGLVLGSRWKKRKITEGLDKKVRIFNT